MGFAPVHLSMSMIISISGGYWSEAAGINQAGQVADDLSRLRTLNMLLSPILMGWA
jgi:hypothetical protein